MKKYTGLVIAAGEDSVYAIGAAQNLGVKVAAMDGDPNAKGFEIADEAYHIDISDVELVGAYVKKINPDFIIPVPMGRMLSIVGWANEMFHLKGLKEQGSIYSTDKYKFHQQMEKKQLRNCKCMLLPSGNGNEKEYHGRYPAIIKPRYGSGSRSVYFLNSELDLKRVLKQIKDSTEDFILEELEAGDEYGVDGAVIDGKFQLILVRKKIVTPPPVRQAVGSLSITENEKLLKDVALFFQKAVECMDINQCLLNADIIVNENGIFPIEVSARPSGHNLHNLFVPLATGIDMMEQYIKFLMGDKDFTFIPKYKKKLLIRYFDFENCVITSIPSEKELKDKGYSLLQWKCNIKEGERMEKVIDGHSIMGRGYFVLEGNLEVELQQQGERVLEEFGRM